MDALIEDFRSTLLADHEPPYLSLYQPTHRRHPENLQDGIRFRNLVKTMTDAVKQRYPECDAQALVKPFEALADDRAFWNHTLDGLAALGAPGVFRVYRLQRPVPELVVVANSFHVKPLIRIVQSADSYQILALSRREIKLFEGNRDSLDEIEIASDVPATITDALGTELTEPHQTVASYGKGADGTPMRHGHGAKKDELDIDTQRFFRAIDRAVLEHHSRKSELPLILAALPEYHGLFRQVSINPFLVADGIDVHPDAVSLEDLRQRAWKVMEPQYLSKLAELVNEFGKAISKGLGSSDLAEVARTAAEGRIATLLVDANRHVPGNIDESTGAVELDDSASPTTDDLLDDVGEIVLRMGGQVIVVPSDRMPTKTGLGAIYRY